MMRFFSPEASDEPANALRPWLLVLLALVLAVGCSQSAIDVVAEDQEPHFRRGKALLREGRDREALEAFLKVIDQRPDAVESHLEAGRIHLDHLRDPVSAIYHFTRYRDRIEDETRKQLVEQLIETSRKEFARRYARIPLAGQLERVDLEEAMERQKTQIAQLQEELGATRRALQEARNTIEQLQSQEVVLNVGNVSRVRPGVTVSEENAGTTDASVPTEVEVQAGDTLSRISNRVFGTSGRWRDIFEANRDVLNSPHDIRPGMVLRVPQ